MTLSSNIREYLFDLKVERCARQQFLKQISVGSPSISNQCAEVWQIGNAVNNKVLEHMQFYNKVYSFG